MFVIYLGTELTKVKQISSWAIGSDVNVCVCDTEWFLISYFRYQNLVFLVFDSPGLVTGTGTFSFDYQGGGLNGEQTEMVNLIKEN